MAPGDDELERRLGRIEERLTALEDREEIRRLVADYRIHIDSRNLEAFSQLFADDGIWSGPIGEASGPAAIRTMLEGAMKPNPPAPGPTQWHVGMDPVIDLDGDRATAVTVWGHARRGPDDTPTFPSFGHYSDTFVKTPRGWRFRRRSAGRDIPSA